MLFSDHPTFGEIEKDIAKVNESAIRFLRAYALYSHRIDDIIDDPICRNNPEFILETFANAAEIMGSQFYRDYSHVICPHIQVITSIYADSIQMETSDDPNKHIVADTLRHAGLLMMFSVMSITIGYEGLRKYSPFLWQDAWDRHHDKDGKRI